MISSLKVNTFRYNNQISFTSMKPKQTLFLGNHKMVDEFKISKSDKKVSTIKSGNKENTNFDYNPLETGIPSIEERNQRFPKDDQYRKTLASAIGLADPDKLAPVIGIEELTAILRNAKESYFRTDGIDAKTGLPNNKDFRVNLHIHTQGSDGKMTIESLLDQQAEFSKKSGHPVLFAVTNHDTIDDARKAIEIIAANPEKYKNVLFVPGIEFNAKYRNDKLFNANKGNDYSIQLEEIGYSINPFDKKLNEFLETRREGNKGYVQAIIDRYNEWGLGATLQEARSSNSHLRYMGSPGLIPALKDYIKSLFANKGWIWKDDQGHDGEKIIREMSDKYGRIHITPSTPSYKEVIDVVKESGSGEVGLAHPGRIALKGIDVDGNFAIKTLVDDFAKAGGKYVDYNYQYPDINKNPGWQTWVNGINEYIDFKHPEITKAGGMDNHGTSIF